MNGQKWLRQTASLDQLESVQRLIGFLEHSSNVVDPIRPPPHPSPGTPP
ncbi:MAG: hypothetical protein M1608_12335 [Candidatus Omnitrophica bacterium]|nr:hypothetical protein [Candidatus Omnitrophota bacterium]